MSLDDYLPTEAGLSQGAKGDEVTRLQRYLEKYGYIVGSFAEQLGLEPVPGEDMAPPLKRGTFDERTVTALKAYQGFYGLPESGKLDKATLQLMSTPRCGVPDVRPYTIGASRWSKSNLTYNLQQVTSDLSADAINGAIEQAFALWSAYTGVSFQRVAPTASADIVIRFGKGKPFGFDGPSGVLAHAQYPPNGDTDFDDDETWTVDVPNPSGSVDLVSVAAHEFGHALGLDHSSIKESLMYAYYGGVHRYLHSDDVDGIQKLYGAPTLSHAMWIHGNDAQAEYTDRIEYIRHVGNCTYIVGKANTDNWFHFTIPTPVIVGNRKRVGSVMLRYLTGSAKTVVRDVHVYDGETRIATHAGLSYSGNRGLDRFGVATVPTVAYGLGISVRVAFGAGTQSERSICFISAGCDFL